MEYWDISVCDNIIGKRNILIEYLCIRSALLPYVNGIILAQNNDARIIYEPKVIKEKSKFYYKNFINGKLLSVGIMSHFLQPYCIRNQIDEKELFVRRVCYEQEKKLKEFNFKMLYGILPCGANLKKWKIRQTSLCDVCKEEQTITHLLFECQYVVGLWKCVSEALEMDIVKDNIICGCFDGDFRSNNIIITIICFLIYKDWLLNSIENRKRTTVFNMELLKSELQLRMKIYEKM